MLTPRHQSGQPDTRELAEMAGERVAEMVNWHTVGNGVHFAVAMWTDDDKAHAVTSTADPALAVRLVAAIDHDDA